MSPKGRAFGADFGLSPFDTKRAKAVVNYCGVRTPGRASSSFLMLTDEYLAALRVIHDHTTQTGDDINVPR